MITADALRWPPAHARNAATQGIDIEVDLDAVPTVSEFDMTLLEAHGSYSKEATLANLRIWAKPREHYSVGGLNDDLQEELLRPEPAAAFHELDALRSDDSLAQRAIQLLAKTQIPYRETLADRLEALLRDYQEDYEDRSLSPTAIAAFVSFLSQYPSVKKPSVTATPAGDLMLNGVLVLTGCSVLVSCRPAKYSTLSSCPIRCTRGEQIVPRAQQQLTCLWSGSVNWAYKTG